MVIKNLPKITKIPSAFWQNRDWYVKRFNWYPLAIAIQIISIFKHPQHKVPFEYKWAGTFTGESAEWYWDHGEMMEIRKKILKKACKSRKFPDWYLGKFMSEFKKLKQTCDKYEEIDFKKLTDKELVKISDDLLEAESGVACWGYIVDSFLSTATDDWLTDLIMAELKMRKVNEPQKVLMALTAPVFNTFVNLERIDLLAIGKIVIKKKLKKNQIELLFKEHQKKFHWVEDGYWESKNLSAKDFTDKLFIVAKEINWNFDLAYKEEVKRTVKNLQLRQKAFKQYKISKKLQNILYCSDIFGLIQDTRKQAALRLVGFMFKIGAEVSRRTGLTREEALNLIPTEIGDALAGKMDRQELQRRLKKCFIYFSTKGNIILSGKEAEAIKKEIFACQQNKSGELKGMPAFHGVVKAKVRIVNNHSEMAKFKTGEILVTNNTTPEFVPLMKKAAAIITEQGGVTTHAAIVSRELKVPCIVGAAGATRTLKTGNLVEVDANKGIVRKI